ncbi:MAG: 4-(cytidine 5'-diphospho)-2-C-methyl-D-erythritol kinase [Halieaceae bacterium]|jgi:4-diphosphocytidyl-2-C-methyl-D-erythritol kinase|nr:4-(cytidine 5'-diphospho)-2-C-methyl-D-erythritol kinase [Halieaceae bacterium]
MAENATLILPAPAKLNLFLHITGRRADGYHELQTVFQLLDHGDELRFTLHAGDELRLRCSGPQQLDDVADKDNLVLRAARRLRELSSDEQPGVDIQLIKRLPTGGGVGGGSSDAATTLLALNHLWNLKLDDNTLALLGRELGADVPVFVRGDSAWAEGVGEKLTPLPLPESWYLVIHPGCHVSTQAVFTHPQLTRDPPAITIPAFFAGPSRNDCEPLVRRLYPEIDKALIWLEKFGGGRLTGTGACVFASFPSAGAALQAHREVPQGWQSFVARGVNRSAAREALPSR